MCSQGALFNEKGPACTLNRRVRFHALAIESRLAPPFRLLYDYCHAASVQGASHLLWRSRWPLGAMIT
jgi:hypothetical protein